MDRRCAFHAERPAHALCMTCRKALCQECAATWEGIYYCATCVSQQRQGRKRGTAWGGWLLVVAGVAAFAWMHARLLVWVGVLIASWK
jgi:hypothetical protein